MKVWRVQRGDYGDIDFEAYCSSEEIANAVADHNYAEYKANGHRYYSRVDYSVDSLDIDEYYKKHLSKLQRALK